MENSIQNPPKNWARRFFTLWTGQAISLVGSALVQFALVWWLTQETGSATILATASLVAMLPRILIGPFAGALVDRWNRQWTIIIADSLIAGFSLLLAWLFLIGRVEIWHVYVIMAIRAIGEAFHFPAWAASVPLLVPQEQLTRINGINHSLQGINSFVAPPLGAMLLGLFGTQVVLMIDAGTAALAVLLVFLIGIPQPERTTQESTKEKPSLLDDIGVALKFVRGLPGLVSLLVMALFLNFLLTPTSSLLPLVVTKHFGKGAIDLGFMESAEGIGIILGGIILGVWGGFRKKILTSMFGIFGLGLGIMMIGLVPADKFTLAVVCLGFVGFMVPMANGPLGAIFQTVVPRDMQGRFMSLVNSAATAMSPLGLLIAGPVSDALGVRFWFWAGGSLCLLICAGNFFNQKLLNIEQEPAPTPASIIP